VDTKRSGAPGSEAAADFTDPSRPESVAFGIVAESRSQAVLQMLESPARVRWLVAAEALFVANLTSCRWPQMPSPTSVGLLSSSDLRLRGWSHDLSFPLGLESLELRCCNTTETLEAA